MRKKKQAKKHIQNKANRLIKISVKQNVYEEARKTNLAKFPYREATANNEFENLLGTLA